MDAADKPEFRKLLLSLIPESGSSIGNVSLREKLQEELARSGRTITDQDYWSLRDALIDEGRIEQGRGRGGSVHRVVIERPPVSNGPTTSTATAEPVVQTKLEKALYQPFLNAIAGGYVKENRIKRFVSEITTADGRQTPDGKWTRPDVVIAAVRTFQFNTPNKKLEIISFEVKPNLAVALEGVYESIAHSAFAHRSFLAVNVKEYKGAELPDNRIIRECERHGIGYMTFEDPADYGTFNISVNARVREPDAYEVDNFIRTQLSEDNRDQLREFLY